METSRDDVGIAIRSAFLKRGTQQRFSLLVLVLLSIAFIFIETIESKPLNYLRAFIKDSIYRGSLIVSSPSNGIRFIFDEAGEHINLYKEYNQLKQENEQLKNKISESFIDLGSTNLKYENILKISNKIQSLYYDGNFDVCVLIYNKFKTAISQEVTPQQIIPLEQKKISSEEKKNENSIYTYEPDENEILRDLLPKNVSIQIFKILLESNAGEQGARMAAMDNATRNAGEMIDNLTLKYNRTRQAFITKELIEIISGAESV